MSKNVAKKLLQKETPNLDLNKKCQEIIRYARSHSPFYKKLYEGLPDIVNLTDLPVIQQEDYWKANQLPNNQLLTAPLNNGIIFNTGGTSGDTKFSAFTREEWDGIIQANAQSLATTALQKGDRIGNLFRSGGMYGSFTFTSRFLDACPFPIMQFPIVGQTDPSEIRRILSTFDVNVLLASPTKVLIFAEYLAAHAVDFNFSQIERVFYAGEIFYEESRRRLREIFPNVQIYSLGYASNDGGPLGYADTTCKGNEHRIFGDQIILEILDEQTLQPISEPNREGLLFVTNLHRKLMPTIRYPVGDKGMWVDPEGTNRDRKFKLLGRVFESARIGLDKVYLADLKAILAPFEELSKMMDFQIIIYKEKQKNGMVLRIASSQPQSQLASLTPQILKSFVDAYPSYQEDCHQLQIEWVSPENLEVHSRTGKLKRIIDKRS